jgi:hypothetical protein
VYHRAALSTGTEWRLNRFVESLKLVQSTQPSISHRLHSSVLLDFCHEFVMRYEPHVDDQLFRSGVQFDSASIRFAYQNV